MLVVGLAVGFFIGFGVTNKDLDVDWKVVAPMISGAIATTVTAITALYISNKWSRQKGAEVVADEAKNTIKEIFELNKILSRIKNYAITDNELKGVIEDLGYLKDIIKLKLNFFNDDIKSEDQQQLSALNDNLETFYGKIEHYKNRKDRPMVIMYLSLEIAAQADKNYIELLLLDIESALTALRNISLYKSLK